MKFPLFSHVSGSKSEMAFTIVELMVASTIGLLVLSLAMSSALLGRTTYREDVVRTRITQNLRSAADIIALNARQAGQSLEPHFPAILVIDGDTDELILRRNLFEREVLNICQSIASGTIQSSILVSNGSENPISNCRYSNGWATFVNTWSTHRQSLGGETRAFAFNRTARLGEFFTFTGETNESEQLRILRSLGTWQNNYVGDGVSAALYLLEEFRYRVEEGVLQLIVDDQESNFLNVVDGITNFQVVIHMADASTRTTFTNNDTWTDVASIEIILEGQEQIGGRNITGSISSRIFARNILSH